MRTSTFRALRVLASAVALVMFAASCGDDGDTSTANAASDGDAAASSGGTLGVLASGVAVEDATTGGVEGCGDEAVGDANDKTPDRMPARCEPGFPAPVPLAEKTKLKVNLNFKVPSFSALMLADAMGEFEKENLEIEFVNVPTADALGLLATGDIDISTGAPQASFYSAVHSGLGVKAILGNGWIEAAGDTSVPQQGIWARADVFSDPDNPDIAELKGKTLGSSVGLTSVVVVPMELALNEAGVSVNDMRVEQVPGSEMVTALENNSVQAAWVLDPYWQLLADREDFILLVTNRPREMTGMYIAGPKVLTEKRDAGVAFARAMQRTINTYMPDGFPKDPSVFKTLADAMEIGVDELEKVQPNIQDWEMRNWTITEAQQVFMDLGQLPYSDPIPLEDLVDWTLYLDALGAK